ncbi:MAG: hypothetical protein A2381_19710 [Bdellovibrionales bacterium RIFOXYB1_FULL_37_110]|nr:MAG: hypothetical protein A2181_06625 [Bdellovibrionales bacterium RIFOXYA1_FULL_38_20]OFZ45495.1 MAG: hypothetical protein A2417_18105 [Bdellovibrionales bacterium RIFOXYC1_FULL_37_79]OFZ61027.1 MAG: hypothetical protein A2381_19710 [Bdellovibrionales bacterium RIFOXYB1_FULL_37_110]OFZ63515.1 MAG: hypothetical protein A2577_06230 [Bdellovibrionales bacterium RIFOXYD1_FULL_36_51]
MLVWGGSLDVIKVNAISKIWPGLKALDKLSFLVQKGTIHGFLGPNGAGKSTTLNILVGLTNPSEGMVEINGTIGFLPENPPLYENMVVDDYLKFVAQIFKMERSAVLTKIDEIIIQCSLMPVKKRLIKNLSKGFKQRVALAQAMICNPDILILDEPTVGLDPNSVIEFRNLILSLKEKHTILFSSHQLSEVDKICDDLTIINKGKLIASGSKEKIKKMFGSKQVLNIELLNWNTTTQNDMSNLFGFERVEVVFKNSHSVLKIYLNTLDDIRTQISKYLVEKNCGLISMNEERLDLEDIFKEITKG